MIAIGMVPEYFDCIKEYSTKPEEELGTNNYRLSNISEDGLSGHIVTQKVEADFYYNVEASTLTLENEIRYKLDDLENEDTIAQQLISVLGGLNCDSSTPTQDQNSEGTQTQNQPVHSYVKEKI